MSDFAFPSAAGQRTAFFKRRSTGWIGASLVVLGLVAAVVALVAPAAAVAARTHYGTDSGQITPSLGGARNAALFVWVRPPGTFGNGALQRAISKRINAGTFGSSSIYVPYKSRSLGPSAGCCHKLVNLTGFGQWRKRWHEPVQQRLQLR